MGIDSLNKDTSGASLVSNFKDIFPGKLEKLFIYKGTNLVSKGNEVFSREDTTTYIALDQLAEVDVIFGGEALTSTIRTITESKNIKETARQKISTNSVTAFLADLGNVDLTQHNLFYTVGAPFTQGQLTEDQLEVLSDAQITPNLLEKLLTGTSPITVAQAGLIKNNKTASFTLSPAVLDNNLPASTIRFVDSTIYKVLPTEEIDFEITSIDLESDQSLALEWRNGIKGRGIIENEIGNQVEDDIDFMMDKPLLPLQINPYATFSNIQFEIQNFNYYQRMPYISAKHFLSADRSISTFIADGNTEQWVSDLSAAIVDMFKMSWAISTGFQAYRSGSDATIGSQVIGGVSLKSMEGKDPDKLFAYVDQILRNWEYKNNVKNKNSIEYKRALQVLANSSEVVQSSYCVGKGLTEFHKSTFDYWLDLNTTISEGTTDIIMTLASDKYVFTYEQTNGQDDLDKPIINLSPILDISNVYVTNFGRQVSLGELDDPISVTGFANFAGNIDPEKAEATKYFVGIDVTDPDKIASLLVNDDQDIPSPESINYSFDTSWYASEGNERVIGLPLGSITLKNNQQYEGSNVLSSGKRTEYVVNTGVLDSPTFSDAEREAFIRSELNIPANAHNVKIDFTNVKTFVQSVARGAVKYSGSTLTNPNEGNIVTTSLVRFTGTIITYDITTTTHGVVNKQQNYDKASLFNMVLKFSDDVVWKRKLTLDKTYRDTNGALIAKMKSINHIFISAFLGNYIDIKLNYKYKDDQGAEQTGTTLLPRINLPAKDDERRTKLGIRL